MKKIVMSIALGLSLASALYASCMGPICWDESGNVTIAGQLQNGNGVGTPSMTKALTNTTAPNAAGMEIYCSDCTQSKICVSTGTSAGAYVIGVATGAFVAASYPHCS